METPKKGIQNAFVKELTGTKYFYNLRPSRGKVYKPKIDGGWKYKDLIESLSDDVYVLAPFEFIASVIVLEAVNNIIKSDEFQNFVEKINENSILV